MAKPATLVMRTSVWHADCAAVWHGLKFQADKNGLAVGTLLASRETEPADRSPVQPSPGA